MATVARTTGVAGCALSQNRTGVGDSGTADVIVNNAASEPETIPITTTDREAGSPHTSGRLDVSPGETVDRVHSGRVPTNTGGYSVEVSVEDWPGETFERTDPAVQQAPLRVAVDDTAPGRGRRHRSGSRSTTLETPVPATQR
jgi:hypothetical protein